MSISDTFRLRKVLVIELTRLGDVICDIPAIKALKKAHPSLNITILVEPFYKDILIRNPYISRIFTFEKTNTILGLLTAIHKIREERFDLAISLSPAKRNTLVTYFSRAKYKVGYFTLKSKFPGLDEVKVMSFGFKLKQNICYKKNENLVERALKPIRALGLNVNSYKKEIYIPETDKFYIRDYLQKLRKNQFLITIHPCSKWKFRNWPIENYIKLINAINDCDVFLLGTRKDKEIINEMILKSDGNAHAIIGMPLLKVAALIKHSNLFIGGDSGLLHIADAVGVPIIGLFGPSNPEITGPLSKDVTIIKKEIPCSPCRQKKICAKNIKCMELIKAEEVLKAVKEKLIPHN